MFVKVAGKILEIPGEDIFPVIRQLPSLRVFASGVPAPPEKPAMRFEMGRIVPPADGLQVLYDFEVEGVRSIFGRHGDTYDFRMTEGDAELLAMRKKQGDALVEATATESLTAFRFGLWMACNLAMVELGAVAIHSSTVVRDGRAVLFLGESGTGKSTHTRLWLNNLEGSWLLNDDSPFITVEHGQAVVYGSPWSGKTHCYKPERIPIAGIVRLSQAPHNQIRRLPPVAAFGAIYPSLPPAFAYDEYLTDRLCALASKVLEKVPVYHLECLPDRAAALLSSTTVFG